MSSPRPIGTTAALAVALALPAAAGAAEPFMLDPGGMKPHVAVAENGTGHFVFEATLAEACALKRLRGRKRLCVVPCGRPQRRGGDDRVHAMASVMIDRAGGENLRPPRDVR